jgi:hypothetical protein
MRSCLVIAVRIAQQDGVQVLRLLQIPRRWLLGAVDKTCIKHAILLCCGYGVILLDLDWDCLMLKPYAYIHTLVRCSKTPEPKTDNIQYRFQYTGKPVSQVH